MKTTLAMFLISVTMIVGCVEQHEPDELSVRQHFNYNNCEPSTLENELTNFEQVTLKVGESYELYVIHCMEYDGETFRVFSESEKKHWQDRGAQSYYSTYVRANGGTSTHLMDFESREDAVLFITHLAEDFEKFDDGKLLKALVKFAQRPGVWPKTKFEDR